MSIGETVKLTKDQAQKNTSTIKTGSLTLQNSDPYFSNFSLEFLTKTPAYDPAGDNAGQQFQYTVYVKDKKGDTDTITETFTVVPDLPPEPEILMQEVNGISNCPKTDIQNCKNREEIKVQLQLHGFFITINIVSCLERIPL